MTNDGRREGPELTNESRSLSLVDLQDSSPSDGLDDSQWQRRTGLLPLSFQNPVYHMTTTSPRQPQQQTDATPSDGSAGSQGNADDRIAMATKPAFLTQMSVGLGGGERGDRTSAMSSSSSGEEYSRRALSLTETLTGTTRQVRLEHITLPPSLTSAVVAPPPQVALPPLVRTPQALRDASISLLPPILPLQDLLEAGHLPACSAAEAPPTLPAPPLAACCHLAPIGRAVASHVSDKHRHHLKETAPRNSDLLPR